MVKRKVFYAEMPRVVQEEVAKIREMNVRAHKKQKSLLPTLRATKEFNITYGVVLCHHGPAGDLLGYYYEQ